MPQEICLGTAEGVFQIAHSCTKHAKMQGVHVIHIIKTIQKWSVPRWTLYTLNDNQKSNVAGVVVLVC